MYDDETMNRAMQVDVLAAALKSDRNQNHNLVTWLAEQFESMLPSQTTIVRDGWLMKSKTVKSLTIRFRDVHFVVEQDKHGHVQAKELKIVRDVVLKTTEVPMEQWIENLAKQLSQLAESNGEARQALSEFLLGK